MSQIHQRNTFHRFINSQVPQTPQTTYSTHIKSNSQYVQVDSPPQKNLFVNWDNNFFQPSSKHSKNSKSYGSNGLLLSDIIQEIPEPAKSQTSINFKFNRDKETDDELSKIFQLFRLKGQVDPKIIQEIYKLRQTKSRYLIKRNSSNFSSSQITPIDDKNQVNQKNQKKFSEQARLKQILSEMSTHLESQISLIPLHQQVCSFMEELPQIIKKGLDINYTMIKTYKERNQQNPETFMEDEQNIIQHTKLMLFNYLQRISSELIIPIIKYKPSNALESPRSYGVHKYPQFVDNIYTQMSNLISDLITILAKVDLQFAQIVEAFWKIFVLSFNLQNQFWKEEKCRLEGLALNQFRTELKQEKEKNLQLMEEMFQNRQEFTKKQKADTQKIQTLEQQINIIKAEFKEYKQNQEEIANLEHAEGCLHQMDDALKRTKETIYKMQDSVDDRDMMFTTSLKNLVTFHKIQKQQGNSITQLQAINQGLDKLKPSHQNLVSQVYGYHPFFQYMLVNNYNSIIPTQFAEEIHICKIKDPIICLRDWFLFQIENSNLEDANIKSNKNLLPIFNVKHLMNQLNKKFEKKQELDQNLNSPQIFINYLRNNVITLLTRSLNNFNEEKIDYIVANQLNFILCELADWFQKSEDLEKFNSQEKEYSLYSHFFSQILGVNNQRILPSDYFSNLCVFIKSLILNKEDKKNKNSPDKNKLLWQISEVNDINKIVSQTFNIEEYKMQELIQKKQSILDFLINLNILISEKREKEILNLKKNTLAYPQTRTQQIELIYKLGQNLALQVNCRNTQQIFFQLLLNYQKFLKYDPSSHNQKKKEELIILSQETWTEYINDSIDQMFCFGRVLSTLFRQNKTEITQLLSQLEQQIIEIYQQQQSQDRIQLETSQNEQTPIRKIERRNTVKKR